MRDEGNGLSVEMAILTGSAAVAQVESSVR
jgi:hypothetical protein